MGCDADFFWGQKGTRMRWYYSLSEGQKIKQQHFSSITHDGNSTDKLEDDGALILAPSLRFKGI